jgi:hypothetical protein
MNRWIRIAAAPALAVALASCGAGHEMAAGSSAAAAAEPLAAPAAAPAAPAAPKGTALGDLVSVGSEELPQRGSIKIDTKVHENSLFAGFGCRTTSAWEFDLNREYKKLTATAGVDDFSYADDEVHVKVLVDGRVAGETDVKLGAPQEIGVDVTNGLRLRVETSRNSARCVASTGYSTNVALANASLTK